MPDVIVICGKPETIFNASDFEYHIGKVMGDEAAKYFHEFIEELQDDLERAERGEDSDLQSYEESLDSNTQAFNDILEETRRIMEQLQAPRMKREVIIHSVREIGRIINNQI